MEEIKKQLILLNFSETIDELIVINRGFKGKCIKRKEPVDVRYRDKLSESAYQQLDPFHISNKQLNEVRLKDEIYSLITILSATKDEFKNTNSNFQKLLQYIQSQQDDSEDEERLLREYKNNLELMEKLENKVKSHFSSIEVKTHCSQEILNNLKNELEHIRRINAIELQLVVNWEKSRFEQAQLLGSNEERSLRNDLKDLQVKYEAEHRFIEEMNKYFDLNFTEFEENIKFWQNKYETETKRWDTKIAQTNENIEKCKEDYEKYREIFEERKQFIQEYLAEKAEEQFQFELQMKRVLSAIKIQAWWRGTMVRRGLGPYKKKKKSKKSKKGK